VSLRHRSQLQQRRRGAAKHLNLALLRKRQTTNGIDVIFLRRHAFAGIGINTGKILRIVTRKNQPRWRFYLLLNRALPGF